MRLHLISIFHTIPALAFSHCAFTGKALRFPRMMQARGFEVIEYANAGSEAGATEHVTILDAREYAMLFPPEGPQEFYGNRAVIGSPGWTVFNAKLVDALRARVRPGDVVCHPFGMAHAEVVRLFPEVAHVETGIGYQDAPFGAYRIFESRAWQHYHFGKHGEGPLLEQAWVVPNYYDVSEWAPRAERPAAPYVLQLGRVCSMKGVHAFVELAHAWRLRRPEHPLRFLVAGQGDIAEFNAAGAVEILGAVSGLARRELVAGAEALVAPSLFVEPFCGVAAEGLLSGVPAVVPGYGGTTEYVTPGFNGERVDDGDWLGGLERAIDLGADDRQRLRICADARARFSLETCGASYERIFDSIARHFSNVRRAA